MFRITAGGLNARIPQALPGLVSGEGSGQPVDAHAIQPFYAGLLARTCKMVVAIALDGENVVVTAQ